MAFVNLNRKLDRTGSSRSYYSTPKRNYRKFFLKLLILVIFLGVVFYFPARGAYLSAKGLAQNGRVTSEGLKNGNFDQMKNGIKGMKSSADNLNGSLNWFFWMSLIPYFGGYYQDAKHFSGALRHELSATETIFNELEPSKVELGFTGQPIAGVDRVAQVVKILNKTIPNLDKIEPQLKKASDEVSSIDVNKYPEQFRQYRVRSLVDTAKNFIMGAHFTVTEARDALEIAPSVLGEPSAKNYLIVFQNDKELRGTGGFMTAYAFLKLDKGRISSSTSDDIYRLDEKLLSLCKNKVCPGLKPPAPIVRYLPEVDGRPRGAWSMRDSNLSPDVATSMKSFEGMYEQLGDGLNFDGIILIDTYVVEELIKITGPIEVYGTTYTAEHDNRCNCPNVIYELENYAQIIEKGEKDRKAILGTLMQQLLARSLGSSTERMPEFINAGVKLANGKHIMFYMHDGKTQQALERLNWTGKIREFSGDYLHINDSNFAGGKSNLYVTQNVELEIKIDDGKVRNKLTINYKNPQKYTSWLNNINRDYVRIYVPKGAKLISSKGSDVAVTTIEEELGKTVFEAFIQVRPENSRTLNFEYELPNNFSGNEYPILIQKQPGTKDFKYEIKVNGKSKERFELSGDKELRISI